MDSDSKRCLVQNIEVKTTLREANKDYLSSDIPHNQNRDHVNVL